MTTKRKQKCTSVRLKARNSRANNKIDWTEQEIRRGLARLIRELRNAVDDARRKSGLEDKSKLPGRGARSNLTERERAELASFRNHRYFLSRIPALVKALDHPAVGLRREMAAPYRSAAELRREQLYDLFAALGTAAIYRMKLKEPILSRLTTGLATSKNIERKERILQIIAEETPLDPANKPKPIHWQRANDRIVAEFGKKKALTFGTFQKYAGIVRAQKS